MSGEGNEEKDITMQLLEEKVEATKKQIEEKEKELPKPIVKKRKEVKSESIASETPQDRFRRIVRDQGHNVGIENMTSVFFEGDTDNPIWLDDVLKLSHIPAKNREMIITAYYGKPIKELGITVEPGFTSVKKAEETKKAEEIKKADEELDFVKMSREDLNDAIRNEKSMLALAQMRNLRKELEDKSKGNNDNKPQYQMRQVIRPMIKDGALQYAKDGTLLTETVVEAIDPSRQSGSNGEIVNMLALRALNPPEAKVQTPATDPTIVDYIKKLDQKIETMESTRQLQAKEEEIKRLVEKIDRKDEDYKKEIERKEKEFSERLDKMNDERIRDLQELKERFNETIQHKKELDEVVGNIAGAHKKEIDALKQKLEHSTTNIEKTIVSNSTEAVNAFTKKTGDIVESVIKPMADVMKDHYKTIIDQTRANSGLPSLRDTLPQVTQDELEKFANGE